MPSDRPVPDRAEIATTEAADAAELADDSDDAWLRRAKATAPADHDTLELSVADHAVNGFARLVNLLTALFLGFGGFAGVMVGQGIWKVVGAGLIVYAIYGVLNFVL